MNSTLRRLAVIPAVLSLSVLGLAACGDDDSASQGEVKVSGAFGTAPKVKYDGLLKRDKSEYDVITEGKGAEVKDGDAAYVEYYLGNGFNGKKVDSTFDADRGPQLFTFSKDKLAIPALVKAVVGRKVGSRISVVAAPKDAFQAAGGNADLGVGNADTVVIVVDIVSKPLSAPEGKKLNPAGAPKIKLTAGNPTGFDFTGAAPVGATTTKYTLIEGTGPKVKKGQTVSVNYLGQVFKGGVFDASYPKGQPFGFQVGSGGVIPGWDKGLVGVPVGSRVILTIPSAEGYGEAGSGDKIKAGDDLVFVVDVLGAV